MQVAGDISNIPHHLPGSPTEVNHMPVGLIDSVSTLRLCKSSVYGIKAKVHHIL